MIKFINLGNERSTLEILENIGKKKPTTYDIRVRNSHITKLNTLLGRKVFHKDVVYINSTTLWELMQPVGGKGRHHYHGLSPKNIFDALSTMHLSNDISVSYDNRYVIVTLATIIEGIVLTVVVTPKASLLNDSKADVIKLITIYPIKKK